MREGAQEVVGRLRAAGFEAYWVGGCVRDELLGREPEDYDVATNARPEQAAPLFEAVREVGRHFGVLQVRVGEDWFEVATFRTEGPYTDGRHPDRVAYADLEADVRRRDFTVNALLLDPETGAVIDLVGGRDDLAARSIRAVGDPAERFAEDALRLLRAVRFACRLGFAIEPATWEAMRREAGRAGTTSAERVRDELLGVLTGPDPRRGLELLHGAGLLRVILPEVAALDGCTQSPRHHPEGDVWEHTLRMLAAMRDGSPELALGVLLHDVGKPATRAEAGGEIHFHGHVERGGEIAVAVLERLRFPNRTRDAVEWLVLQHLRFLDAPRMKQSTLRRFLLQDRFDELLELHRLDCVGSRGDLSTWEFCRREREALQREPPPVRPLLGGDDLIALGHAPGPRMGEMLRALVDAQLEGEVADRDAALAWVRARYGAGSGAAPAVEQPPAKGPPERA